MIITISELIQMLQKMPSDYHIQIESNVMNELSQGPYIYEDAKETEPGIVSLPIT